MKHLISILVATLISTASFAQAGHLSFLDFPMGGGLVDFYQDVLSKGFVTKNAPGVIWKQTSGAKVKGTFAGQDNTEIMIYSDYNKVNMVLVTFPSKTVWDEATTLYSQLKESFTQKYKREPDSKGDINVEGSECSSKFQVVDGIIMLSLKKDGGYVVGITYADKPGTGHEEERRESSMLGDL